MVVSLSVQKRNKTNKATAIQVQQTAKRRKLRDMKTLQAWKLFNMLENTIKIGQSR